MKELSRPASKRVDTIGELKSKLDRKDTNILGFFTSESSDLYKEFMAAAEQLRGIFTVMHTFNQQVTSQFKANDNTVNCFIHNSIEIFVILYYFIRLSSISRKSITRNTRNQVTNTPRYENKM